MIFLIILLLFYILCWVHMVFRIKTGGKHPDIGPREYLSDPNAKTVDTITCLTVVIGTVIIVIAFFSIF